jgi:ribosomal-protein-serine acetyltransferase
MLHHNVAMTRLPDFVETARLTLRTWNVEDAEALGEAVTASVDHLAPFMPWAALEPLTIDDRVKLISGWDTDWQNGGDVVFGVFLDETPIGGSGLHRRRGPNALEIGYWIHVDHVRNGYAREVSAALTDLAFTVDGIESVEIHHDRANVASAGVPQSLGFELIGETQDEVTAPGEDGVDCAWRVTKASWPERSE